MKRVRARLDDSILGSFSSVREAKRFLSQCAVADFNGTLTAQERGGYVETWNGDEWRRAGRTIRNPAAPSMEEWQALKREHIEGCRCPECDPVYNDPRNVEEGQ